MNNCLKQFLKLKNRGVITSSSILFVCGAYLFVQGVALGQTTAVKDIRLLPRAEVDYTASEDACNDGQVARECFFVAKEYLSGKYVEKNEKKAATFFSKAAEQDHAGAQYYLAGPCQINFVN